MYSLLAVTVVTFVGTTLDNLLMLTVLRASGTATRDITAGFMLGNTVVLLLCAAGTGLASVLPVSYLGYLGIVPVALGLAGLATALSGGDAAGDQVASAGITGIATLQIASSLDTLVAFLPLFADTLRPLGWVIAGGFALMSVLWLVSAFALARVPAVTASIRPVERYARPLVLVLVGIYVLMNTSADVEPDAEVSAAGTTRPLTQTQALLPLRIAGRDESVASPRSPEPAERVSGPGHAGQPRSGKADLHLDKIDV